MSAPEQSPHTGPRVTYEEGLQMVEQALLEKRLTPDAAKRARYFLEAREQDNVIIYACDDFQVKRVREGDDIEALLARHNVLSASEQTAQALYACFRGDTSAIEQQQDNLIRHGGFFEPYDEAMMKQRVVDENFIILQAGGRFFNMNTLTMDPFKNVADIQIQLPQDDPGAEPVAKIVEPKQDWLGCPWMQPDAQRIYQEISQNSAIMACITDIGVNRGYGRYTVVPFLQNIAIHCIDKAINPKRENPIRYLVAQFFLIHGLKVPSERNAISLERPIDNRRSFNSHWQISAYQAPSLANVPPQDTPVTFEYEGKKVDALLQIGWSTTALDVETIATWIANGSSPIELSYPSHGKADYIHCFERTS